MALVAPRAADGFDPDLVAMGRNLALIGDRRTWHSPRDGAAYSGPCSGGLAFDPPVATIHSTDITLDPETGIGRWSQAPSTGRHSGAWTDLGDRIARICKDRVNASPAP